jgi:hypothetical protein
VHFNNPKSPKSEHFEQNVYTSRFPTAKQNYCNRHIYHCHVSESLSLTFFVFNLWGNFITLGCTLINNPRWVLCLCTPICMRCTLMHIESLTTLERMRRPSLKCKDFPVTLPCEFSSAQIDGHGYRRRGQHYFLVTLVLPGTPRVYTQELGSPSGELILAPQKIDFIDLRQVESN